MGSDMDDMEQSFFKYVYIIVALVGVFILVVGIIICCKLKRRSTKGRIVYGGGTTTGQGIVTTQSLYHQYGTAGPQMQPTHGTPVMRTQPPPNATGFPNPYYGNYSPQTQTNALSPPYPTGNQFIPQIPQQSQSQTASTPYNFKENESNAQYPSGPAYFTNEACNAPPSYEEIHTEVQQKQPAYNPNYADNSNKY